MTHLLELRVKINLSKSNDQIVQTIYTGWQWLGIFEIGAIILTLLWSLMERKKKNIFGYVLSAFICFLISIIIFFLFTFPTNQETVNWTSLPSNWQDLRTEWEYSHATRALLNLIGFMLLMMAMIHNNRRRLTWTFVAAPGLLKKQVDETPRTAIVQTKSSGHRAQKCQEYGNTPILILSKISQVPGAYSPHKVVFHLTGAMQMILLLVLSNIENSHQWESLNYKYKYL